MPANVKAFCVSACHFCGKSGFIQKRNFRDHYESHGWTLPAGTKGRHAASNHYDLVSDEEDATIIVYQCPSCHLQLEVLEQLGEHIKQCHLQSNTAESESEEPEEPATGSEPLPRILPSLQPDNDNVKPAEPSTPWRRNFDEAIISACQQTDSHLTDQKKTLFIMDTLKLMPLAMVDKDGTEQNVLAHESTIGRITAGNDTLTPILPLKRKFDEVNGVSCIKCAPTTVPGLEHVMASSPYGRFIRQRQYVELSSNICKILNNDWEFHPQVKYFTAKVFSGAIIYNTRNGEAIMANTVEAYGRTKHVDPHRETFGKEKGAAVVTSVPPPVDTLYPDVWPVSLQRSDGVRLVIGTQVSNVLITSSIRLDAKMKPSIGSKCISFQLPTFADSMNTRIFLDSTCQQEALAMLESPEISSVSPSNIIYQLRQIRSKFSFPQTFALCRSSGPITKAHTCQPFTVFTLADYDRGNSPGATLFRAIGVLMLKHGKDARLPKDDVEGVASVATGKIKTISLDILRLYPPTGCDIPILKNDALDKYLSSLAELLMPSIVAANESVAIQIAHVFDFAF